MDFNSRTSRYNLVELTQTRAAEKADRRAFTFLEDGEAEAASLTYADLDRAARRIAAWLQAHGSPGERALLLYPQGLDFIAAFLGCLYAGVVAVPAYPPRLHRSDSRLQAILADARPRFALTTRTLLPRLEALGREDALLGRVLLAATDGLDEELAADWRRPDVGPETVAFLQYTSGSTSQPKGVIVTHGNLLHNEEIIRSACGYSEETVMLSWLPLFHDMGLIGAVLQPLYIGGRCVLMSPSAFLQKPLRWLQAVSRWRATTSGGPNFAYDLCVRKIPAEQREGLDLSSWALAFNGAEPVRSETLDRFAEAFAPCGFRREAFYPCYGLAEATLFVSGGSPAEAPRRFEADAAALEQGEAAAARDGHPARVLASCGRPWQEVLVVDPATGEPCPAGRVGEIWLSGPSVAGGYWDRPEETARMFQAVPMGGATGGSCLRTGDLGFLAGGELFITGRLKDLIILRGRNHYPQDIELTVEQSSPVLRPGCGAAFAVSGEDGERLVVVQEVERGARFDVETLAAAVREAVAREHEIAVHEVVLLKAGGLSKTSSGKVQRRACRDGYLAGTLPEVGRSREAQETGTPAPDEPELGREDLLRLDGGERRTALLLTLRRAAARAVRCAPSRIEPDQPLDALGMDSLAAAELRGEIETVLGVTVPLASFLEGLTLAELVDRVSERLGDAEAVEEGPRAEAGDVPEHRLSHGQRALWFLHRLAPEEAAYNIAAAARLAGPLDAGALRQAFQALVDRHPSLRSTFVERGGEPVQRFAPAAEVFFQEEDAAGWSAAELALRLADEAHRPFDLETGPLLRVHLFTRTPGERILLLAVHHIVADFRSLEVLVDELHRFYSESLLGRSLEARPLPLHWADVVEWQHRRLAGPRGERLWDFWRRELDGGAPPLDLSTDRLRPPVQTWRGGVEPIRLGPDAVQGLRALARGGATLPAVLLAAFQALLHRYTHQEAVAVGVPAADRGSAGLGSLVGYLVNPLVVLGRLQGRMPFGELVERTRGRLLAALEHRDFPFPLLAERLQPERDPSRPPLYQAMLVFQRSRSAPGQGLEAFALGEPGGVLGFGDLRLESMPLEQRAAQVELELTAAELGDGMGLALRYNADLFDAATARRLLGHLERLLAGAAPETRIAELELLSMEERRQVILAEPAVDIADTVAAPDACIHELFEAQAERTPEKEALVSGGLALTYAELNRRAGELAQSLRRMGVEPESGVGIFLDRSPEMVAGMLGVLKAGGYYVPLDPAYPESRLAAILEDSGTRFVLSRGELARRLPASGAAVVDVDAPLSETGEGPPPPSWRQPGSLAYAIYTSGSTGRPKGVLIEHRSAAGLLRWARASFSDEELGGLLASTSICFDLSVFEIFAPLAWGGRVILARDALALPELPARDQVRLVNTVPSAMAELVRSGGLPAGVSTVCLAGEPLPLPLVRSLGAVPGGPSVERVLNLYGPSEDTTYSTWVALPGNAERITVGRPLPARRACILGPEGELLPVGVPGELHLGGYGLARGYSGRPDLTADRFVPDPFAGPGERLYRTGDLARLLPDGRIDLLGRVDHQVKIRGFRIELGEIEARLEAHPGLREAVVTAPTDGLGTRSLAAWVVGGEGAAPGAGELREWLRQSLPEYMVPARFVFLDELPRTPNGKVDRKALPAPGGPADAVGSAAPRTPAEELVAGIFADLLEVPAVGIDVSFFEAGGHSLSAMRLLSRVRDVFGVDLPARTPFEAPTVAALAARVSAAGDGSALPPVPRLPAGATAPASFAQQRFWFLDQLAPGLPAYNLPLVLRLRGDLDFEALAGALTEVVRRHEPLRTLLAPGEGHPLQVVQPAAPVPLPIADAANLAEARAVLEAEARMPFDLGSAPPLRARLLRLPEDDEWLLALTLHHSACDGWGADLLWRELSALYADLRRGEAPSLAEPPARYADFAVWQRECLAGGALDAQREGWKRALAGLVPLQLPEDRPRPPVQSFRGGQVAFALPDPTAGALRLEASRRGATLFMAVSAAFAAALERWTGQRDVAFGSPVAGRGRTEWESLVGCFVNMLVLRVPVAPEHSFDTLLRTVRGVALEAYSRQDVPFEALVEEHAGERNLSRNPLFQAALSLQSPRQAPRMPEVSAELLDVHTGTAKFDLSLMLVDSPGGIEGSLEYAADLFDEATAARMAGHLERLLAALARGADLPVGELPLLSPEEETQLRADARGEALPEDDLPVHRQVKERAREAPDALAVVSGGADGESLTYGELVARATRLARHLRSLGVGPEGVVAVCGRRSADGVVALLAALEAGGAFLPLDPNAPAQRLASILKDSGAPVLLTWGDVALPEEPSVRVLRREEGWGVDGGPLDAPDVPVLPSNLAYVIYTSGSTGTPKGVQIPHRGLSNLVRWHRELYRVDPADRATLVANPAFDASVWELWPYLTAGASIAIPGEEELGEPDRLLAWMARAGVSLSFLPTPLAEAVLDALSAVSAVGLGLRSLLTGGDRLRRLPPADAGFEVVNHYGPTECSVVATCAPVRRDRPVPPIGRPIANLEAWVVDPALGLAPAGVPGELWLGGAGLARGYLGRPDLTAERFVPSPFGGVPGERLYRTGDLVRRGSGGLEFLGRIDHQVKIRGNRVELGEIESALLRHPGVREAVVIADAADGFESDAELVAYVAGEAGVPGAPELRSHLEERLPRYMVPALYVLLERLPLTPNGKPDRAALPRPDRSRSRIAGGYVAPRGFVEEELAALWADLLEVERIGVHDDFFELGGHSLKASRLITRVREAFEVELPLRALFEAPTVAGMAAAIARQLLAAAAQEEAAGALDEIESLRGHGGPDV